MRVEFVNWRGVKVIVPLEEYLTPARENQGLQAMAIGAILAKMVEKKFMTLQDAELLVGATVKGEIK